jgi:hypothetical protein
MLGVIYTAALSTGRSINYTARTGCPSLREPNRAEWRAANLFFWPTVAEQSKKARTTTIQTTPAEQASEPPSDAFTAALVAIPTDDWCRTWAEDRTMLLRMTSKRVKEVVDKLRPPAAVKVSTAFRADARHGTAAEQLQHILR